MQIYPISLLAIAVSISANLFAADKDAVKFSKVVQRGEDHVEIQITAEPFLIGKHQIAVNKDGLTMPEGKPLIDGKRPIGIDPYVVPSMEIKGFNVTWNGVSVPIEKELYSDIYMPDLHSAVTDVYTPRTPTGIVAVLSADGSELLIEMRSVKCAAAPYTVWWLIRREGKSTRFVLGEPH